MSPERKAFYEYHASLMEPWDGPASIAFTDGTRDRRGARPQRPAPVALLRHQGRPGRSWRPRSACSTSRRRTCWSRGGCSPGRMFLVDTVEGPHRRRRGAQARARGASSRTASGSNEHLRRPRRSARRRGAEQPDHETVLQAAAGVRLHARRPARPASAPMATNGEEPIGSMGTDTPLAVLSDQPRLLYNYFKQLFAQVTNPPLDAIREELVTSMGSTIGPERNLLEPEPESCRQIKLKYPIIHNEHLAKLRHLPPDVAVPLDDAVDAVRSGERRRRRSSRRWTSCAAAPSEAVAAGVRHPDPVATAASTPSMRADPEPAGDCRRASPPGARGHAHAVRAGRRDRATRARCITSRCCSATAPARSTRTSRSRRSTT